MSKNVSKLVVVIVLALIFIVLALINSDKFDFGNRTSHEIFSYKLENCVGAYCANADNFFVCAQNTVKFFDANGTEKWTATGNFSEPIVCHQKKILGVCDLKQNTIYVYDQNGEKYFVKIDGNLLTFSVNQIGFCTCISKLKDSYHINVYNPSGEKILTYVHSEENVFPINACLSPNSKFLAVVYIDTDNAVVDSKITFMKLDQNDIFASVQEKNNFVYGLKFLSDYDIILISDKHIVAERMSRGSFVSNDEFDIKQQWHLDLDKDVDLLDIGDNLLVIKFHDDSLAGNFGPNNTFEFYDLSGKKLVDYSYNGSPDFVGVQFCFNGVLLGSYNDFVAVDAKGKCLWHYPISGECKSVMMLGKPNRLLLVAQDKISVVEVGLSNDEE